jgi:hypothetical protein
VRAAAVLLAVLATGCATTVQPVNVPVPVECRVAVPERPAMPTESLRPGVGLDAFAQAAMAEIERREGYEGQLVAALATCTRPLIK